MKVDHSFPDNQLFLFMISGGGYVCRDLWISLFLGDKPSNMELFLILVRH